MEEINEMDAIDEKSLLILEYLDQLNDKEKIAYKIAKEHLGSSFQLTQSIGYLAWLKK